MNRMRASLVVATVFWAGLANAQAISDARVRHLLGPQLDTLVPLDTRDANASMREFMPPLRLWNNQAAATARIAYAHQLGLTGKGVIVGVVDSGLDLTHADFLRADGTTRVRWLLDFASAPRGKYAELEQKFGYGTGIAARGAVYDNLEIDALICCGGIAPGDRIGHGTHVAGTAAARASSKYPGMAPDADLVIVRAGDPSLPGIDTNNVLRGVKFIFDRATAESKPAVVNLSLGSDYGPHDGSLAWETELASLVGPAHPGRAVIAAAGNSGSPSERAHEQVYVAPGSATQVVVNARRNLDENGKKYTNTGVYVWVRFRPGASLTVGLRGPDGTRWVAQQRPGREGGYNTPAFNAAVVTRGSDQGVVPNSSPGAMVAWVGAWPDGAYKIELEGEGVADLYVSGDTQSNHFFSAGLRESTVGSPAAHPDIIAVGATVNRGSWTSRGGASINVPLVVYDRGGEFGTRYSTPPREGEVAWFSSAGPTTAGVPKPELLAPGAGVISAMSAGAPSSSANSVFSNAGCPTRNGQVALGCFEIDATHALSFGTSMATPVVTGASALLLQAEPTLTQDKLRALLQGGVHTWRVADVFHEQGGAGELDVAGSLAALDRMRSAVASTPALERSWVALSHSVARVGGAEPVTVMLELRGQDGLPTDLFSADRLQADVRIGGQAQPSPAITRLGPGVFRYDVHVPDARGGEILSLGATFDGRPCVTAQTLPIGTDPWRTFYGSQLTGGCSMAPSRAAASAALTACLGLLLARLRRRRSA